MDKFALFAGDFYYPVGGWSDFKGEYGNESDAITEAERLITISEMNVGGYIYFRSDEDWVQVVNLTTLEIVFSGVKKEQW